MRSPVDSLQYELSARVKLILELRPVALRNRFVRMGLLICLQVVQRVLV